MKAFKYFFPSICLALLATVFLPAYPSEIPSSWIISEQVKLSEGLKLSDLCQALKAAGIEIVTSKADLQKTEPSTEQEGEACSLCTTRSLNVHRFWKGKTVDAYLAPDPFAKYHVWIVPKKHATTWLELNENQKNEVLHVSRLVSNVFKRIFNQSEYVAFVSGGFRQDHPGSHFCLEMIPRGEKTDDAIPIKVDIAAKLQTTEYMLYGEKDYIDLTLSEIEAIRKVFLETMNLAATEREENILPEPSYTLPWKVEWYNIKGARDVIISAIYRSLMQKGALLASSPTKQLSSPIKFDIPDRFPQDVLNCAFCNETIVLNQLVYAGEYVNVLYNFMPYIKGYHFLITPKASQHVERWENLSDEEQREAYLFAGTLQELIKEETGRSDCTFFVQNGSQAGQTMPHTHLHVLLTPDPLEHSLRILVQLQTRPHPVSKKHMEEIKAKWYAALKYKLEE